MKVVDSNEIIYR